MNHRKARLRRGDYVEVKSPDEILKTLDADGAIDHMPFMPEMIEFCGRRFKVSRHAVTICFSGGGSPRSFNRNDVFSLEGLRCSGAAHDGCRKACTIFWREAWLRKVEAPLAESGVASAPRIDLAAADRLRARLRVTSGPKTYFCQASELLKSSYHLSTLQQKIAAYFCEMQADNFTLLEMARIIWIYVLWRIYWALKGVFAHGRSTSTPTESLNVRPGDWVEVKPMKEILETVNAMGLNRGLMFSPDMRVACGKRFRVTRRLDKIIADGTGEMRQMRNTVCLENTFCDCAYMGLGKGCCARNEHTYWREIWLRRCN